MSVAAARIVWDDIANNVWGPANNCRLPEGALKVLLDTLGKAYGLGEKKATAKPDYSFWLGAQ